MKEETKQMGLMKKLTSAIVASSLVFSLVGTAFAAYTPAAGETAGNRMLGLKVLTGKYPNDALALKDEITRAELVTVMVRAFGQDSNAALLKGAAAYPDTANHWASGNIAMAKALVEKVGGEAIGMPDGKFNPDGKLTPAQAVAFLMKFLGVKADATKAWPANYLDKAVELNIITAEDKAIVAPMLNDNATRGLVFYLFDRAFYTYDLGAGKTFYTKYVDTTAPVVTLGDVAKTTIDSKVTVTGKVEGAKEVYVGTKSVTVDANGNFSSDYELPELKEYSIAVTARDAAGNTTEKTVAVARTTGNVATIEAADITVAAGAEVEVKAVAKDTKGNTIANATITGESAVGTFTAGKFVASKTAGNGTLTLKAGEVTKEVKVAVVAGALATVDASAASVAPGTKVTLTAKDANGNVIANGVTYTQTSADALLDSTQGVFIASKAGSYTVTAKAGDVTKEVKIGVYDAASVASYKVNLGATTLVANQASTTTLNIQALDKNGNANTASTVTSAKLYATVALEYSTNNGDSWADLGTTEAGATTITLKNGAASLLVRTETEVGGQTSIVTAFTDAAHSTTASKANLVLADQVATTIEVKNSDTYLASNATTNETTFAVRVLDQDGKALRSGYFPVTVALNSGVEAQFAKSGFNTDVNLGAASNASTFTVYYSGTNFDNAGTHPVVTVAPKYVGANGTVSVSASATGLTAGSKSVAMQLAGQAAKLTVTASSANVAAPKAANAFAGDAVTYTIGATDAVGVPVSNTEAVLIHFPDLTDTNRGEIQVTIDTVVQTISATNNTVATTVGKSFSVKAETFTGALNFVVKDAADSNLAATATQAVTFKANAANTFTYKVNGTSTTAFEVTPNTELSIVATLKDAAGNATTNSAAKVKITVTAADGGAANDVVINGSAGAHTADVAADGTVTFTVKTGNFVGASYTLAFTGTYTDANGAVQNFTTLPGNVTVAMKNTIATNVAVALFKDAAYLQPVSTIDANDTVYGYATVTDAAGRNIATEAVKVAPVKADGTLDTANAVNAVYNAGKYEFTLTPAKAPASTFKAYTTKSVTAAGAQFTIGVRPATTVAKADVTGDATQSITKNVEKAVTIQLTDAYGNVVINNSSSNRQVTLAYSDISANTGKVVQFRTASNGLALAESASRTVTLNVAPGATSVTVYVVTNMDAGTNFTLTAQDVTVGASSAETVTLNVQ